MSFYMFLGRTADTAASSHAPARAIKAGVGLELTAFQKTSSAIQTAVPAFVPELVATLQKAEAHRLPQRLGQAGFSAAESLLAPAQAHLLALLQVRLPRRLLAGKRTWQEHQGFPTCQPERAEGTGTSTNQNFFRFRFYLSIR